MSDDRTFPSGEPEMTLREFHAHVCAEFPDATKVEVKIEIYHTYREGAVYRYGISLFSLQPEVRGASIHAKDTVAEAVKAARASFEDYRGAKIRNLEKKLKELKDEQEAAQ